MGRSAHCFSTVFRGSFIGLCAQSAARGESAPRWKETQRVERSRVKELAVHKETEAKSPRVAPWRLALHWPVGPRGWPPGRCLPGAGSLGQGLGGVLPGVAFHVPDVTS